MTKRLFIGIELPIELKQELGRLVGQLTEKYPEVKAESEEKLHLTLKFLGNTQKLPEIILSHLTRKLIGQPRFALQIKEIGFLISKSVSLIVEVQKQEELLRTYHKINNEMETLGFPRDKREFHPHVTIARCKETFAFVPNNKVYKPFLVSQITLFQSTLTSRGSKYTKLNQINLGA